MNCWYPIKLPFQSQQEERGRSASELSPTQLHLNPEVMSALTRAQLQTRIPSATQHNHPAFGYISGAVFKSIRSQLNLSIIFRLESEDSRVA